MHIYLEEERCRAVATVGCGSIVTKVFDEPNVIIAGIPAKVVKRGVNWDRKCINKYLNG